MYTESKGFSLIEMAISLAILGYLISGVLNVLPEHITNQKRIKTIQTFESITQSITGYYLINMRLPCPDIDDDGIGDNDSDGECSNSFGNLPWADLGVGRYDGWDKSINYAVEKDTTVNNIYTSLFIKP